MVPVLGMVGVFAAIGWRVGPWLPVGVVIATAALFVWAAWWTRKGRQLMKEEPAAGREMLNAQSARVGHAMGTITAVWVASSILFIVLLLVASRL
jgi:hypothetical protein